MRHDPNELLKRLREKVNVGVVRATDGGFYLRLPRGKIWLGVPVESKRALSKLARTVRKHMGIQIKKSQAKELLEMLLAKAMHEHLKPVDVYHRVGACKNGIEVLLSLMPGTIARVTSEGVEVRKSGKLAFSDTIGFGALPIPLADGDMRAGLNALRRMADLEEDHFKLYVMWMLGMFSPIGPYPLLIINGGAGSGKSTLTRFTKMLLDPTDVPLRVLPTNDRGLNSAARNNRLLAFDNVSSLSPKMADSLCRISTGGGVATSKGQGDTDESVFGACRPVILNGIDDFANRNDLIQRSIMIKRLEIEDRRRMTEHERNKQFEADWSLILGTLLRAVAHGLKRKGAVKLGKMPRMADFLERSVAACEAFNWKPEKLVKIYVRNQREAFAAAADADSVFVAVRELIERECPWNGTASELLGALNNCSFNRPGRRVVPCRDLPKAPNALVARLNRGREALASYGISLTFDRDRRKGRQIHLGRIEGGDERSDD